MHLRKTAVGVVTVSSLLGCQPPGSLRVKELQEVALHVNSHGVLEVVHDDLCRGVPGIQAELNGKPLRRLQSGGQTTVSADAVPLPRTICVAPSFEIDLTPPAGRQVTVRVFDASGELEMILDAPPAVSSARVVSPSDGVTHPGDLVSLEVLPLDVALDRSYGVDLGEGLGWSDEVGTQVVRESDGGVTLNLGDDDQLPPGDYPGHLRLFAGYNVSRCTASFCEADWASAFEVPFVYRISPAPADGGPAPDAGASGCDSGC